jgi:hypothetical protein
MLIPFVVKEEMEIDQISSDYLYYINNLCDKTWLLFEGVVPLCVNIAKYGLD